MQLWDHQERSIPELRGAIGRGRRAVVCVVPTGGGKTIIASEIARLAVEQGKRVVFLTNRKILRGQASDTFDRWGVQHGILAAGFEYQALAQVKVISIATLHSRVQSGRLQYPDADLVLVDEAHSNISDMGQSAIRHYLDGGSVVIGFTATPVGLAGLYDELVVVAPYSELIRKDILVPCRVFGPSEPDMEGVKVSKGEYVQKQMRERVMECTVFGHVIDEYRRLNPWGLPTLLFAPGVPESIHFCEAFTNAGVVAEHIDGNTPDDERQAIFRRSREGDTKIVSSCGVLREGFDAPWIRHGILLQPCHGLKTYLQICGRLMRRDDGKSECVLADMSGAWHRHGPPDSDRQWSLDNTDVSINTDRRIRKELGEEKEGICCPKCSFVREFGPECPQCGHRHARSVRKVRQIDGTLKPLSGPSIKRRNKPSQGQTDAQNWDRELYAACWSSRTVAQCEALFFKKYNKQVPRHLIQSDSSDRHRRVKDLPEYRKYAQSVENRKAAREGV